MKMEDVEFSTTVVGDDGHQLEPIEGDDIHVANPDAIAVRAAKNAGEKSTGPYDCREFSIPNFEIRTTKGSLALKAMNVRLLISSFGTAECGATVSTYMSIQTFGFKMDLYNRDIRLHTFSDIGRMPSTCYANRRFSWSDWFPSAKYSIITHAWVNTDGLWVIPCR